MTYLKPYISSVLIVCSFFLFSIAEAHGGVEKNVGSVTVYISQDPISPLVGERVKVNFLFADKENNSPVSNLDVALSLVDTLYGDESKDAVILTQELKTDDKGAFDFEYTFTKANYFDIDMSFIDPKTAVKEDTGLLIQTRERAVQKGSQGPLMVISLLLLIIISIQCWHSFKRVRQRPE